MKKKRNFLAIAILSTLAVGAIVTVSIKNIDLRKKLAESNLQKEAMSQQVDSYKELLAVDSLLVSGNYQKALKTSRENLENHGELDSSGAQLRMELAQRFMELHSGLYAHASEIAQLKAMDSVDLEVRPLPREIRQFDSLSFVLEKTKTQLARLKRQLRTKSFGEYLTFKSSKGTQVHYVGQVRNNRANGHGLALLSTGSRYEGEWKDNMRHGSGTFHWPDGEYYMGEYVNDKRSGQGTYYWANGERFVGLWENDKRTGEGTFYGKEGKVVASGVWEGDELVEQSDKKSRR